MEFKENTDFDLIGLGEVMLRLSPPNKEKISQSETFEKNAGGSELNVVSGAAMLGIRSAIVTKLPENKMGHFIRNKFVTETCPMTILYMTTHLKKDWAFITMKAVLIRENHR